MTYLEQKKQNGFNGFTLVEIIVVVVILGIAALVAVPMLSSAADMQVRAAANRLAADLDYAKGLAVTYQTGYAVVFNTANESYDIRKSPYGTDDIVKNPVRADQDYIVNFTTDSNMSRVAIDSTAGLTDDTVTFDYLGSPYSGAGTATPLNSGVITLQAGDFTMTVDIEPMTGYVSISGL